ncbi:MAG TPA: hypothetical protein VMY34_07405, partial [Acidimicrobiales bacterium]|nr:hypothetical protein [Acidimicrobiales bacterium]
TTTPPTTAASTTSTTAGTTSGFGQSGAGSVAEGDSPIPETGGLPLTGPAIASLLSGLGLLRLRRAARG